MRSRTQAKVTVEERRKRVAALYLARSTQEQIAAQLGVHQTTISRDILAITAQYRAAREDLIDREVAELDAMERDCAVEFAKTRDPQWVAQRLAVKKRRAAMLGLDRPAKLAVQQEGPIILKWEVEYVNDWRVEHADSEPASEPAPVALTGEAPRNGKER